MYRIKWQSHCCSIGKFNLWQDRQVCPCGCHLNKKVRLNQWHKGALRHWFNQKGVSPVCTIPPALVYLRSYNGCVYDMDSLWESTEPFIVSFDVSDQYQECAEIGLRCIIGRLFACTHVFHREANSMRELPFFNIGIWNGRGGCKTWNFGPNWESNPGP